MTTGRFDIRDAVAADVPALARLHVDTFIETHGGPGPAFQLREQQWREAFAQNDPSWFCYVITRADGALVGLPRATPTPASSRNMPAN